MSGSTHKTTHLESPSAVFTRRYDLDWLRIGAFGLLIFYHIGMFFNTEGWHAKSGHANDVMEPVMWLSSPWRLPLLFFISGVAIRFLSDKLGSMKFAGDRVWRLFPVILFGMYVIVAPQTYVELLGAGAIEPGWWNFYQQYAGEFGGPWSVHTPTWNHLWYVVYLFVYSLLLAPLFPVLRWLADSNPLQVLGGLFDRAVLGPILLITLPALPFLAIRFTLVPEFPTTHALFGDWANHANSLSILLIGYFFAKNQRLWAAVDRALPWTSAFALASLAFLFTSYSNWEIAAQNEAWVWLARIDRILFAWTIILALAGLARRFLNQDGPVRRYLSEAVFPYYILHQTITVAAGYWIGQMGLGVWTEFVLLVAITFGGCALGFEVIKRIAPLRPVMGLKLVREGPARPRAEATANTA